MPHTRITGSVLFLTTSGRRFSSWSSGTFRAPPTWAAESDVVGAALIEHYAHADRDVPDTHISGYATAHPSEDWAETFGHYLHLRDGLETADEFTLDGPKVRPGSLASMLERWRRITSAVNAINLGLGHVAPYPYTISLAVETKLAFVHDQIERASESHISVASH